MRLSSSAVLVATLIAVLFSTGALAGNTKLLSEARKELDLRGFDRVEVLEFADATKPTFDKAEDEQPYRAIVAEGGRRFGDFIVTKLNADKGFAQVGRDAGEGKRLKIGGRIEKYKESNIAARYIGLGIGGSKFDATIEVRDADDKLLGTMTVDLTSSPVPGATNVVQTVGFLMDSAAQAVSDELRIAKHTVHREETGRSGRGRDKYKSGH